MKWLRLYTEARTDNKLRSLSDKQFRIWFNLLCMAGEQSDGRSGEETEEKFGSGSIAGYDLHLLAVEVANGDVTALQETVTALQALHILHGVTGVTGGVTQPNGTVEISFKKFADRQYIKPSNTPERVRERVQKYRDKKRLQKQGETQPKTGNACNANETPGNAMKHPSDTDTEEENTPPTPSEGEGERDPVEPEDAEPFHADSPDLAPEPEPRVKNAPAVVKRVAATADRLFPGLDYGPKVFQLQGDYDVAVLEAALFDAHAETDARKHRWTYIKGIYTNRMTDGRGSSLAPAKPVGRPPEKPAPSHPVHTAPADSPFRRQHEAMMAKQREQEGKDS